jgi:mannose-6-phosphate isomerase-like protein (cupin superfamily)
MLIKDLKDCKEIIAGDGSLLKEVLNPHKEKVGINYSLAHAVVKPGITTLSHSLKSSEVYYILQGEGEISIDNTKEKVSTGCIIFIPANSVQRIKNIGKIDLVFLCIVDPAWKKEDEEVLK